MTRAELDDLQGRPWLVHARNEIQCLLLEIDAAYDRAPANDESWTWRWQLAVGAAFSLWRAVFLISPEEAERPLPRISEVGRTFLQKVIDRNAITFGDDYQNSNWTSGYYMNNVMFRVAKLRKSDIEGITSRTSLRLTWNRYFEMLREDVRADMPEHSGGSLKGGAA